MTHNTFLGHITIVELGERSATARCGGMLAELGATVVTVEPTDLTSPSSNKWRDRAQATAGKVSLSYCSSSPDDNALLHELIQRADVLITSSDLDGPKWEAVLASASETLIHCDITAFGSTGPLNNTPLSDALLQAYSGSMWVTGMSDGPPTRSHCNYIDALGATFAVSGVLAALRVRREQGISQNVEISLFDCVTAVNTTFLSQYLTGGDPARIGNRHVSMSPWNSYKTRDGWVVLCTGSNDQWRRVCEVISKPLLESDKQFDTPQKRVEQWQLVDKIVETWTLTQTTAECIDKLNEQGLPCGPVYSTQDLFLDASLNSRGIFIKSTDPVTAATVRLPGSAFQGTKAHARSRSTVPAPDAGRAMVQEFLTTSPRRHAFRKKKPRAPLQGLRVIEIGTYTTAPLTARQLGALGADVVKLEPPTGDPGRRLPPLQHDQGVFFSLGNSDKRAVQLNLKTPTGLARFREMLCTADVFVENLRPGAMAQLGLGPEELLELNPRLIYCSITGFGVQSPYAKRTAMDTTIQAMSGIMNLTRHSPSAPPTKIGVSICDAMGGAFALANILAALDYRDRHGDGQWIDLSMQDIAATLTQDSWNHVSDAVTIIQCTDGFVVMEQDTEHIVSRFKEVRQHGSLLISDQTRSELISTAETQNIIGIPVNSISEAMNSEHVKARNLFIDVAENGRYWTLLSSPLRLSRTPSVVRQAIGPQGEHTAQVLAEWVNTMNHDTANKTI